MEVELDLSGSGRAVWTRRRHPIRGSGYAGFFGDFYESVSTLAAEDLRKEILEVDGFYRRIDRPRGSEGAAIGIPSGYFQNVPVTQIGHGVRESGCPTVSSIACFCRP